MEAKVALPKVTPLSPADILAKAKAGLEQASHTLGLIDRRRAKLDYIAKLDAKTTKDLLEDYAAKLSNSEDYETFTYLAYHWAELDPEAAIAWNQGLNDKNVQANSIGMIFAAYADKNPAAALGVLANLQGVAGLGMAEASVLSSFARQDPQAALAALPSLPDDSPNKQALEGYAFSVFAVWAETDPVAAAAAALNLPDSGNQIMSWQFIATDWAEQDPAAALAWANNLPPGASKNAAVLGAIEIISGSDPQAAAGYAFSLLSGSQRDDLMSKITISLAEEDPTGLIAWAGNNLSGANYNSAVLNALNAMSQSDPNSAATYLAQHPDPTINDQATPALATTWAQQDPPAALAWAKSLPEDNPTLRNSAVANVFGGWASIAPAAAAAYVQQNLADSPTFSRDATQVANSWAQADPQAALKWAESLPPEKQNAAVITAISQLADADIQSGGMAAQNALNSLTGLTQDQQTALQKIAAKTSSH